MLEEVRKLILNTRQPFRTALIVMLQSGLGLAEFEEFNRSAWKRTVETLKSPEPSRIDLCRENTSKTSVSKYYTFIGRDAKELLREWLAMRPPNSQKEELFLVCNKNRESLCF